MGWYFTFYKICLIGSKVSIHRFNHDVIVLLKRFADAPVAKIAEGLYCFCFVYTREVSLHQHTFASDDVARLLFKVLKKKTIVRYIVMYT